MIVIDTSALMGIVFGVQLGNCQGARARAAVQKRGFRADGYLSCLAVRVMNLA